MKYNGIDIQIARIRRNQREPIFDAKEHYLYTALMLDVDGVIKTKMDIQDLRQKLNAQDRKLEFLPHESVTDARPQQVFLQIVAEEEDGTWEYDLHYKCCGKVREERFLEAPALNVKALKKRDAAITVEENK